MTFSGRCPAWLRVPPMSRNRRVRWALSLKTSLFRTRREKAHNGVFVPTSISVDDKDALKNANIGR